VTDLWFSERYFMVVLVCRMPSTCRGSAILQGTAIALVDAVELSAEPSHTEVASFVQAVPDALHS
jgi:hypothetical protein